MRKAEPALSDVTTLAGSKGVLQRGDAWQEMPMSKEKRVCVSLLSCHSFAGDKAEVCRWLSCVGGQGRGTAERRRRGCPAGTWLVCRHRGGSAAKSSAAACAGDGGEPERRELTHALRPGGQMACGGKSPAKRVPAAGWALLPHPRGARAGCDESPAPSLPETGWAVPRCLSPLRAPCGPGDPKPRAGCVLPSPRVGAAVSRPLPSLTCSRSLRGGRSQTRVTPGSFRRVGPGAAVGSRGVWVAPHPEPSAQMPSCTGGVPAAPPSLPGLVPAPRTPPDPSRACRPGPHRLCTFPAGFIDSEGSVSAVIAAGP